MDLLLSQPQQNEAYLAILSGLVHPDKKAFNSQPVVELQALDSLNEIVYNERFKARNLGNLGRILATFLEELAGKNHVLYFEALDRVVKLCLEVFSEDGEETLRGAFEKIANKAKGFESIEVCRSCLKIMRNFSDSHKLTRKLGEDFMGFCMEILRTEKDLAFGCFDSEVLAVLAEVKPLDLDADGFAEIFGLILDKYQTVKEAGFAFVNQYFYSNSNTILAYQALQKVVNIFRNNLLNADF